MRTLLLVALLGLAGCVHPRYINEYGPGNGFYVTIKGCPEHKDAFLGRACCYDPTCHQRREADDWMSGHAPGSPGSGKRWRSP
jgi:hypothetical protein